MHLSHQLFGYSDKSKPFCMTEFAKNSQITNAAQANKITIIKTWIKLPQSQILG
jgi:hypothetical protein